MKRPKTGGRLLGTPNKKSQALIELIGSRFPSYHPVVALAEIANDPTNDISIRLQANKEVAKYVAPQLKAIEVRDSREEELRVVVVRTSDQQVRGAIDSL